MYQVKKIFFLLTIAFTLLLVNACFLVGSKKNSTVDDVFKQGAIDPNLVPDNVSYVPLYPFIKS
jgi:phosphoglycerol transferase MdoB-like AlkP superfamily enzyme